MQEGRQRTHSPPLFEKQTLWAMGCLSLLIFMSYSNSLTNAFLFDDLNIVVENVFIRNWHFLPRIFSQRLLSGAGAPTDFYRPLQTVTYLLDYQAWGLNPIGYHLTNIILHLANATLFYLLIFRVTRRVVTAFAASSLFAVHPVHTQAVTYISGRADLLAVAFLLIGLLSHDHAYKATGKHRQIGCHLLVGVYFLLALLSKELALLFPCFLVAYDLCFEKDREHWKPRAVTTRYLPLLFAGAVYLILRLQAPGAGTSYRISEHLTLLERLRTSLASLLTYARLIVFPVHLHVLYPPQPPDSFLNYRVIVGILLIVLVGALVICSARRAKVLCFFSAWVLIGLLPILGIVPLNAFVAEHWLYIPLMGLSMIFATAVIRGVESFPQLKIAVVTGLILIIASFGTLTIRQNRIWRDPITFFTYSIHYVPDRPVLHHFLGDALRAAGREKEAMSAYEEALRLNPAFHPSLAAIGLHFLNEGDYATAKIWYERAIKGVRGDTNPFLHNDLGAVYLKIGQTEEAIQHFERAISLHPYRATFWANLGRAYGQLGQYDKAIEVFRRALSLDPNYLQAHEHLADLYVVQKRYQEAVVHYQKAVELDPKPRLYLNLGMSYFNLQEYDLAKAAWEKALTINPHYEDAQTNLRLLEQLAIH